VRGIRLMLSRPDVFAVQLRALARSAVHGDLKVMLPMVTVPGELEKAVALFRDAAAQVAIHRLPPLGVMVEVPAVAIAPEQFRHAAFFSIGSNDLAQYVTAASRDSSLLAALNDSSNPAVLKLIRCVAKFGHDNGIPVSLCGDMASDPHQLEVLLAAGIRSISVAPAALARVKAAISQLMC
jgi:phosphotransferase system enzyme I (PtsI)